MIKIFPNIEELNNFAAEKFVEIGNEAIEKRGSFTISLAGGSTPKALYKLLSSDKFKDKIDWSKVFFFFGDERNVFINDDESNFKMANESLFLPLKIADEQIFRWKTELKNAEMIADDYAEVICLHFNSMLKTPATADIADLQFDLILLGMGADGHTASLFPFTEALHENDKFAVANYVEKLNTTRLTLTFPVINNALNVMFLVKGADKAETLRDVLEGEFQLEKLPSQNIKPINGNLFWLCDSESATFLKFENS